MPSFSATSPPVVFGASSLEDDGPVVDNSCAAQPEGCHVVVFALVVVNRATTVIV